MLFINNLSTDPAFNLALEESLFNQLEPNEPGYFLLWQNKPTVIIGRFQNARQEINPKFLESEGIGLIRRLSGGGAVFHDEGTLNYTFIHNSPGVRLEFQDMGQPIAAVLQEMGWPVEFSGRNDLLLHGKKVAGLAYHCCGSKFLHHGCILVNTDLDKLEQVLMVDPEKYQSKGVASVRSRVCNLSEYAPLNMESLKAGIKTKFAGENLALSVEFMHRVQELAASKYSSWDWNYGKSPVYSEHKAERFSWGRVELGLMIDQGRISACKIRGDFMSTLGVEVLESALLGLSYNNEMIQRVLSGFPLGEIFQASRIEDVQKFFRI